MKVERFTELLDSDFFTGVPDSQLKPFCDYLVREYGVLKKHIIGANEGNCVAMAAGHYMAASRPAVVYLQNSGIGNIVNPVTSLTSSKVYGIPCLYVVGWRGEPNIHDEPQHAMMGEITQSLLKEISIPSFVVTSETTEKELETALDGWRNGSLMNGESFALLIKKGALEAKEKMEYKNEYTLIRENVIKIITRFSKNDPIVSTTGKASRELFEVRENGQQTHAGDFLTVGSMGHSSSIALAVALSKPQKRVWCIDGDGAVIMHMGSMAVIGGANPQNLIHIVINNNAHETVGGMPTAAKGIDICKIALACGYQYAQRAETEDELTTLLETAVSRQGLQLIEVMTAIGSRADLGRPTITPGDSKNKFMEYIK